MSRWFNAAAVEWAMFEASQDLPAGARWTLAMVAAHARADGRGAYPAVETLVMLTGRSERTTRRDLDLLADGKLLLPGDRRLVANLRADRRPDVWDLSPEACEFIADHRKRGAKSAPRTGSRGDTMAPRPDSRGAKSSLNGVPKTTPRGVTMAPEEFFEKNSENGTPLARVAGAGDDAPETQTRLVPSPPRISPLDLPLTLKQAPLTLCCGHQFTMREYSRLARTDDARRAAKDGRLLCGDPGCGIGILPEGAAL